MSIGHDMVMNLQEEEIKYVYYLDMISKYFLKQLTDNLKFLGVQISFGCAMVVMLDFKFGAKVQIILESASNIVQFYKTVGRFITNIMIHWDPIIEGNAIKFKDTGLNIAIATVEGDKGSSGKMNKFKYTAA